MIFIINFNYFFIFVKNIFKKIAEYTPNVRKIINFIKKIRKKKECVLQQSKYLNGREIGADFSIITWRRHYLFIWLKRHVLRVSFRIVNQEVNGLTSFAQLAGLTS